jgi:hypothetical protein
MQDIAELLGTPIDKVTFKLFRDANITISQLKARLLSRTSEATATYIVLDDLRDKFAPEMVEGCTDP